MKRELKFRAWLKDEKRMVDTEGLLFTRGKDPRLVLLEYEKKEFLKDKLPHIPTEAEILQFSGQTDRYDNEIYEGDILDFDRKHLDGKVIEGQYKYVVKWEDCQWIMRYAPMQVPFWMANGKNSVVIGNIYQNLDLTKTFIEGWLTRLTDEQIRTVGGTNELFKMKLFNPNDKSMDEQIQFNIEHLYQFDEDYIAALYEEFEDFPELIDQVWKEQNGNR